ncbi:MAG: type II toxin-antitoxin system RelE/ParE family toxin [Tatlockia sp.]|nr:type II toxin-antitoxin system RelE/ParE family toxin [Tatlockia sp.]
MKIKFTKRAAQDIQSSFDFIRKDNPSAANSIITRIMECIENIAVYPAIGRLGRVPNTRELVVSSTPLIIIYQVRNDILFIARIIHASRKWP